MWTFIVVFVLLTAGRRAQEYDSALKGMLFGICPTNQVISQIKSSYSPTVNDRRWKIECKPFDSTTQCSWSADFSLHEQEMSFNCPPNHVVTGVYSDYISGDRRWSFYCCSAQNLFTFECLETPMVNYWKEDFNWHVPGGNFLTGVHTHNKSKGDHRWSFSYCRGTIQDPLRDNPQICTDVAGRTTRDAGIFDNQLFSNPGDVLDLTLIVLYVVIFSFLFMRLFICAPSRHFRFQVIVLHLVFFHATFYLYLSTFQRELLYFLLHYFYVLFRYSL